jgi:very-short-patch-repair endonuclease
MNEIEKRFLDAMLVLARKDANDVGYENGMNACDYIKEGCGIICGLESIECQKPIGIYIVDFYLVSSFGLEYVVEIDGHESHKTKEQRFKDYRRERFLQEEGKTVFRFMASEVYVDALQCAQWVVDIINQKEQEWFNLVNDSFNRGRRAMQKAG